MRDRALKFLAWYDSLTLHEKRLLADNIREQLCNRGVSPKAALSVPHAAIKCAKAYINLPELVE